MQAVHPGQARLSARTHRTVLVVLRWRLARLWKKEKKRKEERKKKNRHEYETTPISDACRRVDKDNKSTRVQRKVRRHRR